LIAGCFYSPSYVDFTEIVKFPLGLYDIVEMNPRRKYGSPCSINVSRLSSRQAFWLVPLSAGQMLPVAANPPRRRATDVATNAAITSRQRPMITDHIQPMNLAHLVPAANACAAAQ
jgi:hypothetical protein